MQVLLKILGGIVKTLGLLIVAAIAVSFVSPFYKFPEIQPFTGKKLFNPYQDIQQEKWVKGNFQVQSNAWGGITNGRKNTDSLIFHRYKEMGFNVISISDYQKVNKFNRYHESYVPVYEHGYGIFKNHQVCLGAEKVEWLDFPVYHTLHHKQYIINRLKKKNALVAIAHPKLWGAYDPSDMTKLTNYDLIEVLNNYRISDEHWDAALSSGKPVFLLANDDAHNVHNIRKVGRRFTVMNVESVHKDDILHSLKYGKSYGVDMENSDSIWTEKAVKIKNLPVLQSIEVKGDTIHYCVSDTAQKFVFIGQNGAILKTDSLKTKSYYIMQDKDTYVRVEIEFENKATFYLNPLFRYNGNDPLEQSFAYIDAYKTNIFRFALLTILIFIFGFRLYFNSKSKSKNEEWLPVPV